MRSEDARAPAGWRALHTFRAVWCPASASLPSRNGKHYQNETSTLTCLANPARMQRGVSGGRCHPASGHRVPFGQRPHARYFQGRLGARVGYRDYQGCSMTIGPNPKSPNHIRFPLRPALSDLSKLRTSTRLAPSFLTRFFGSISVQRRTCSTRF